MVAFTFLWCVQPFTMMKFLRENPNNAVLEVGVCRYRDVV